MTEHNRIQHLTGIGGRDWRNTKRGKEEHRIYFNIYFDVARGKWCCAGLDDKTAADVGALIERGRTGE